MKKIKKKTKVAFIVYQTGNKANGGVRSITEIIKGLGKIQPVFITQKETTINEELRNSNVDVIIQKSLWEDKIYLRIFKFFFYTINLFSLIRKQNIDVIHINDIRSFRFSFLAAKLNGTPIVFNVRDIHPESKKYKRHWHLAKYCNKIIALSNSMKDELIKRLPLGKRNAEELVMYIYSIVDFKKFKSVDESEKKNLRELLELEGSDYIILYAATFMDKKNQYDFINNSLPILSKHIPNLKVCFVGDFDTEKDVYAKNCMEAIQKLKLEDYVLFAGFSENIQQWYQVSDLTALASRREGMARCMIESISCGVPVVSFDVASAEEILTDNKCGITVKQGDYEDFNEKVVLLHKESNLKEEMGKNGIITARNLFDVNRILEEYEAVYLSLKDSE